MAIPFVSRLSVVRSSLSGRRRRALPTPRRPAVRARVYGSMRACGRHRARKVRGSPLLTISDIRFRYDGGALGWLARGAPNRAFLLRIAAVGEGPSTSAPNTGNNEQPEGAEQPLDERGGRSAAFCGVIGGGTGRAARSWTMPRRPCGVQQQPLRVLRFPDGGSGAAIHRSRAARKSGRKRPLQKERAMVVGHQAW